LSRAHLADERGLPRHDSHFRCCQRDADGPAALAGQELLSERLKNAIKHEYDVRLESHKAVLQAESGAEIERLRAELSIAAAQRNVTFSKLHERRLAVIAATYAKLDAAYVAIVDYVDPVEIGGARRKRNCGLWSPAPCMI
jgi:hypothetical protein